MPPRSRQLFPSLYYTAFGEVLLIRTLVFSYKLSLQADLSEEDKKEGGEEASLQPLLIARESGNVPVLAGDLVPAT